MLRKILVPLDGSALAERSLSPAVELARRGQGEVTLLRVPWLHPVRIDDYSGGYRWLYPDQAQEEMHQEAVVYLRNICERWAAEDVTVSTQVVTGDPASVILDVAAMLGIDLICMTTHGYSGFTRWMLGSVTERVLRAAPCPVMVVREPHAIKHVLITLDGSTLAERALEPGLEAARRLGANVTLMQVATVVPAPHDVVRQLEAIEEGIGAYLASSVIDHARLYLEAVAARLSQRGVPLTTEVVEGLAAQSIVDYAATHEVDLIAMATHGRTGLRRWAYGSVTEKVLRSGQCSLLVVRPPAKDLSE